MAISLPLPVRVAAGILATGIDVVRSLPADIPAIPVTLVGNAMRLSMKVQQEIATLATRGDELLGGVVAAPQENPSWAKFDDDEPVTPAVKPTLKSAPTGGWATGGTTARSDAPSSGGSTPKDAPGSTTTTTPTGEATTKGDAKAKGDVKAPKKSVTPVPSPTPAEDFTAARSDAPDTDLPVAVPETVEELTTPAETSVAPITTTAMDAALEVPEAVIDLVIGAEPATDLDSEGDTDSQTPSEDGPAALPGYDGLTLAQLRGHLRDLTPAQVSTLLQHEQDGDNRPPFLTLLSNRLVTLDAQNS